ncbi:MAG: helix-turn-helix domain-containing protein [Spirochaetia bacterium]|nr:helix-turn-helix domain-containing protein [Spirochaetia bacterium]MCF7953661.1 helix-turn-helix domain-containing protein [Spirochaetales bacterium]
MYTLLLVEDEELIRKELLITVDWESVDCRVIAEAADGVAGEKLIKRLDPDIVLTDIRLPGQDGLTMLKKAPPRSAIIFTGYGEFELAQQAIRLGVYDFLLKPVEEQTLYATLTRLTERLALQREEAALGPRDQRSALSSSSAPGSAGSAIGSRDIYVRAAMDYIDEHYAEDISMYQIASHLGVSESHLSHLFKEHSGFTVLSYLQDRRIREAMRLLKDPRRNVSEIFHLCGFSNGSYFCKVFKRYTGVTPSEFRNSP